MKKTNGQKCTKYSTNFAYIYIKKTFEDILTWGTIEQIQKVWVPAMLTSFSPAVLPSTVIFITWLMKPSLIMSLLTSCQIHRWVQSGYCTICWMFPLILCDKCPTQRIGLTIIKSVIKWRMKKLRQTKSRRTVSARRLKNDLQSYSIVKKIWHLCKYSVKWDAFKMLS